MAHPYASEAKASQKRRLGALNAKAGKAHGASSMYKAKSYPKRNAGSSTPMTISGGSSHKRADRLAFGGSVGKRKRRPPTTTNIIISHAGGQGGTGAGGGGATARPAMPVPAPVPVPRPVPVPAGAAPVGPGPAGPVPVVPRPAIAAAGPPPVAPGAGAMPVRPPMAPGAGVGPPGGGMPMRPPGMKAGGAVRKAAKGGFLREQGKGKTYPGFPHSPTTKTSSAVSAHKKGGAVKRAYGGVASASGSGVEDDAAGYKKGGKVGKYQAGGMMGPGSPGFTSPAEIMGTAGGAAAAVPAISNAPGPLRVPSGGDTGGGGGPPAPTDSSGGFGAPAADTPENIAIGRAKLGVPVINSNIDRFVQDALDSRDKRASGGTVKKRQMGGGTGTMGTSFGGGQPAAQQQQGGLFGPGPGRAPTPAIQGPPNISGRAARPAMPLTVPQPPTLGARLQRPAPGMSVGYKKGGGVKKYRDWGKGQTKGSGGSMSPRLKSSETYHQQGKGFADGGSVHGAGSATGRLARNK